MCARKGNPVGVVLLDVTPYPRTSLIQVTLNYEVYKASSGDKDTLTAITQNEGSALLT